jgi:hypothetical protein
VRVLEWARAVIIDSLILLFVLFSLLLILTLYSVILVELVKEFRTLSLLKCLLQLSAHPLLHRRNRPHHFGRVTRPLISLILSFQLSEHASYLTLGVLWLLSLYNRFL